MEAIHLPPTATPEEVVATLRKYGYAIVDDLASPELMDRITKEMQPYIDHTLYGADNFIGKLTKRTGALIARSPAARELVMNNTATQVAKQFLHKATTVQLHLTQIISVFPGSPAQALHLDQIVWDFFPFPADYDVQCNILWAMTDYTEEMGATRVVPGSHLDDRTKYDDSEAVPAVMRRGSALFYTGKVWHGAGANISEKIRQAINITYAVGWVRQEENQYLTTPVEIAKTLPDDLLKLMGYQTGCFALGYVGDFEDPMTIVRDNMPHEVHNTSSIGQKSLTSTQAADLAKSSK
ncbi:phytanoyl-CoA dioxygenase family protein [Komagataeibacter xylinus]|uniref:phytanoyl-CoA dioxygenase family protein n=1 Tax=Komagataeibacter xylinus TaxID=28448 RepID=UPI001A92ECAA|nr:phytanoyl-CoA dioxygenase family protein [Komagataeibacter xylinus]